MDNTILDMDNTILDMDNTILDMDDTILDMDNTILDYCLRYTLARCQGWRAARPPPLRGVALTAIAGARAEDDAPRLRTASPPPGGWLDIHSAARHVDKWRLSLTTPR